MLDKLVTIQLDKERHLRFTTQGMIEYGKLTGQNPLKGFSFKDLKLEDIIGLLWACLIHEDEDLTYKDVLRMVEIADLENIMGLLAECVNQAFPDVKDTKRPLARKPRSG